MSKLLHILFLALVLLYLFYNIDFKDVNFNIFSYFGLLGTFIVIFIGQVIVALRWMQMSKLSFKISFETMIVSTALNVLLPAKLGELSKAVYLKKFYNYSYHKAVSIILIERFFDILALFFLICIWAYYYFTSALISQSILSLSIFIMFVLVFFNTNFTLILLKKIPIQLIRVYGQKIYRQVKRIFKSSLGISMYTIVLWFFYYLSNIVFFQYAVHFSLNNSDILELFIFSTIALALPLTPAGIGAFEGAVVLYLTHHGVTKEDALMSASMYHVILLAVDFLLFYPLLLIKKISLRDLMSSKNGA